MYYTIPKGLKNATTLAIDVRRMREWFCLRQVTRVIKDTEFRRGYHSPSKEALRILRQRAVLTVGHSYIDESLTNMHLCSPRTLSPFNNSSVHWARPKLQRLQGFHKTVMLHQGHCATKTLLPLLRFWGKYFNLVMLSKVKLFIYLSMRGWHMEMVVNTCRTIQMNAEAVALFQST